MSDRLDFFFRQRVTEAELDLAFELLEKADRDLAADLGIFGIISVADGVFSLRLKGELCPREGQTRGRAWALLRRLGGRRGLR